jgi:phage regulator Rha-like protein
MIEITNCDLKMKISKITKLLTMPKRRGTPFVVESRILFLRDHRVILDSDLAQLYGVPVGRLNEQVKRNRERFPADFMFQLTLKEEQILRSQIAISRGQHGGRRYLPHAFTEHGAIMAANVLNSKRAVQMSVYVVRAFVRLREMLAANGRLAAKINELEGRLDTHDSEIQKLLGAIRQLMTPEATPRRRIGFQLPAFRRRRDLIGG